MHPIHRRYHAEDLVRRRRAGERRRYAASQRQGRIDANPHQIDAVMFALRRIPDGGGRPAMQWSNATNGQNMN